MGETRLATTTKKWIEESIRYDQGTAYRKALQAILPKIEDAYRESGDGLRSHLGASLIGRDCSFELYLGFRWVSRSIFPGRILRLFNRGHLEEAHFLAMLESAKIPIWYETDSGGQFRFSDHGGHFGSALDGIVKIPELEGEPAYAEFKTHNKKSFEGLVKLGVASAKHEHYVQMQVCMHKYKLKHGVYFAVNKNDDEIYIEIIDYDHETASRYFKRAKNIIFTTEAMPRISNKESFWKCKFCDRLDICHRRKKPDINCRTCAHSEALPDGTWSCAMARSAIIDHPKEGCKEHLYNPHLMPSVEIVRISEEGYIELKLNSGNIIKHGVNHITSEELDLDA